MVIFSSVFVLLVRLGLGIFVLSAFFAIISVWD